MYPPSDKQLVYETDDTVYFFATAFDPLNNWSGHAVKIWSKTFPTLEHGYHYRKYSETAPQVAAEILAAPSAWATMQIDRKHHEKRRKDWEEVKVEIMTELMRAKVAQNEDVRACLLATGGKQLVKNSPFDEFWGSGAKGTGKNMVGEIFMQIRNELQVSNKNHRSKS